jgi:transposase
MKDKQLYQQILGLTRPWVVRDVQLELGERRVVVHVGHEKGVRLGCPVCDASSPVYDHRRREWRHLDTCQLMTVIQADVPRVDCAEHGVVQVAVPWAEAGSGFTAMFEALAISWLHEASITAVADMLNLSWDQVDGIMARAVRRGMAVRETKPVEELGIDETSYQKRHEYVTVLIDRDRDIVVDVLDGRKKADLKAWLEAIPEGERNRLRHVSMDMWEPYINAVNETVEDAEEKICFDRFHVSQHFGKALDKVRAQEHRSLLNEHGESPLTRTKHQWLRNAHRTDNRGRRDFMALTRMHLRTARAWAIKETAADLWDYAYRASAAKAWARLLGWMSRCRLLPLIRVGRMIRKYLWGILNAIIASVTNSLAESKNARIQKIKATACGFRNRARFRRSILFHLGGLDLMPPGIGDMCCAHTIS